MILHLEYGGCNRDIDRERVTKVARECWRADEYTAWRRNDFKCPVCDSQFRALPGLLQHVESDACDADLAHGSPLRECLDYLEHNLH